MEGRLQPRRCRHAAALPHTAANIFAGTITTWDDPAIKVDNREAKLPSDKITPVHRSDDSGTTKDFTDYLHQTAASTWTAAQVKVYLSYMVSSAGQAAAAKAPGSAPLSSTLSGDAATAVKKIAAQWRCSGVPGDRVPPELGRGLLGRTRPVRRFTVHGSRFTNCSLAIDRRTCEG